MRTRAHDVPLVFLPCAGAFFFLSLFLLSFLDGFPLPCCGTQAAIDGDLCEQFSTLEPSKQRAIAEEMERVPSEVTKKLEDFRNKIL